MEFLPTDSSHENYNSNSNETLKEDEDRISQLPDTVLIHILTYLPTFDAIFRAGLVSKRWSSLTASLSSFVFRPSEMHCRSHDINDKFGSLVDDILFLKSCATTNFHKFGLYLDKKHYYPVNYKRKVETWIRFAVSRNVKELQLYNESTSVHLLSLPEIVFRHAVLAWLSLWNVNFKNCGKEIRWKWLKGLSIRQCHVDDALLGKIMRGCPVLESFELGDCDGIQRLDIESKSLKELIIFNCGFKSNERGEVLRISAPFLRALVINGNICYNKCDVKKLSYLVEAKLHFERFDKLSVRDDDFDDEFDDEFEDDDDDDNMMDENIQDEWHAMAIELLERVQHAKKLSLGTYGLQVLCMTSLPCTFSSIKSLTLNIDFKQWELPGLAIMLENCHELESLTVDTTTMSSTALKSDGVTYDNKGKNFWLLTPDYGHFNCLQGHLKLVKIVGLHPRKGGKLMIEFLQFLMKHARVLERLSIRIDEKPDCKCKKDDFKVKDDTEDEDTLFQLSMFYMLSSFPRSSPAAVIQVISSNTTKITTSNAS